MHKELRYRCTTLPDYYIKVPCGRCALCKERISKDWKVRLTVECRHTPTHHMFGKKLPRVMFITLTFNEKSYNENEEFDFAPWLSRFRDNFRKRYGKSPRYFAITDRGSEFGRLHLHMLLFNPTLWEKEEEKRGVSVSELHKVHLWWPYGFADIQWVENPNVAGYVCGYITGANMDREEPIKHGKPICEKALRYKPRIYVSKGLGKQWLTATNVEDVFINERFTIDLDGYRYALPRYYMNYIWHSEDRYNHNLIQFAENKDYFIKHSFDRDTFYYDYKGVPKTYKQIEELVAFRERFTTPAKPQKNNNFGYTELNFYDNKDQWPDLLQIYSEIYDNDFLTPF